MPLKCDVVDDNPCWGEVTLSDVDYAQEGEPIYYYTCKGHRHALYGGEYTPAPALRVGDSVPADTVVLTGVIDTDGNGRVLP